MKALMLIAVLIGGLAGCAEAPLPPFMHAQEVQQIVIGKTTADEVRMILGRPQQINTATGQSEETTK